ncbi:MAG: tetratricopeptide repeat protein [Flavobacteriales bacterium]|nr:tetratricopeptide repeat protein [Flavobacteriales bacterium]
MNPNSKTFAAAAAFLLIGLTAVYWNHFDNGYHFDDSHTIVNNGYIRDIANLPLFFQDARTTSTLPTNQTYRPMVTALNTIDCWIGGSIDPKTFHWHIFIEFLLLLGMFYLLLLKIFEKADGQKHRLVALLGTAFFAFHAATAETINYIIARSDEFSTLMVVIGILIHVSNSGWKKKLGLLPFVFGCLTKPTTLMLAPILFIYDLLLESPSILIKEEKGKWLPKLVMAFKNTWLYFGSGLAMYFFTQSMASDTWVRSTTASPWDYLNTQFYVIALYLKTFLLPTQLSADPGLELIQQPFAPKVICGLFVILLLLAVAYRTSRKRTMLPISFGILWFFVALIPSSSVVPLADVMNHHRTFFPYLGLVVALSWSGYLLYQKLSGVIPSTLLRTVFTTVTIIVLAGNAYATYQRNEVWDSEESLWKDVAEKNPNKGRGLMAYGMQLLGKGERQAALENLLKAQKTSFGNHPYLISNLGRCYASLGNNELAKQHFELALTAGDNFPECHYHFGIWLAAQGDLLGAKKQFEELLRISPSHQDARMFVQQIEQELAKRAAQNASSVSAEKYLALSLQYYRMNQFEDCIAMCEKAISLRPDYADAYNNMCSAYNRLKQFEKAAESCEKALAIKPDFELAKNNLNWSKQQLTQ